MVRLLKIFSSKAAGSGTTEAYPCGTSAGRHATENEAWGNGASLGEEAVLADSGRAGEVAAGVGRVRMSEFSAAD